ncbi:MAG TPA: hypothetical protein VIF15_10325 [Polyangiaceae bacterium]|jgi:hypothetical protein
MSTEKRDPNATIQLDQLDALDQIELLDSPAGPPRESAAGPRLTPPPLPLQPAAAPLPGAAQAPAGPGRTIAYVAMFVALLAAAITGGLLVGSRAGSKPQPAASATAEAPAAATAAPAPSASTLTIPVIEMR